MADKCEYVEGELERFGRGGGDLAVRKVLYVEGVDLLDFRIEFAELYALLVGGCWLMAFLSANASFLPA